MRFTIKEGNQWISPWWRRAKMFWLPPGTFRSSAEWRCSVDFGECKPGTSIKLVGFADFTPRAEHREHWSHFTHGTSDRIVVVRRGKHLAVSAYGYRDGRGGVTGVGEYMRPLGEVDNGSEFWVWIDIRDNYTRYGIRQENMENHLSVGHGDRSDFKFWTAPHANGNHGPVAPSDITLEIDRR
jgi:hypothetical protein